MSQGIFCPFCGSKNVQGAKFCMSCGANIGDHLSKMNTSNEKPPVETHFTPSQAPAPVETVFTQGNSEPQNTQRIGATSNATNASTPNVYPAVSNNFRFAEFGDRLIAFIIDTIIISLIGLFISFGAGISRFSFSDAGSMSQMIFPSSIIETVIAFLYFWFLESFNNGQTLGKIILKIRTVDMATLGRMNPGQAFIHILGKVFYAVYGLILFLDIIIGSVMSKNNLTEKNQIRLSQRLSKTVVIKI